MGKLRQALLEEKKRLEAIISSAQYENANMPAGYLRISRDKNRCRYYHCTVDNDGIYIAKDNVELAKKLAQKNYNNAIIIESEKQLGIIDRILAEDTDEKLNKVYETMHPDRKSLIVTVEGSWEQKLQKWYETPYQGKEFREGTPVILTEKGERVRSKSEKILADYFYRRNILYKYEKPLFLNGYGTVYPDFTFLSSKTGQEIYWEHEGMMDNQEYAKSAIRKIESYQRNDIFIGENLIITFETEQNVLNQTVIEKLVDKYLKPETGKR